MSVIVSNRHESKFEPIQHAIELRTMLTELLFRNLGVRDIRHVVQMKYARGKENKEDFSRYNYILTNCKNRVDSYASQIVANTRGANSIYPTTIEECALRRDYQDRALVNCEQIVSELQHVASVFDVDINVYRQYIQVIDREISLLKRWRQSDNKIRLRLQGGV